MFILRRLEIEGFGPFAEPQTIEFPAEPGVTVIYGENMRGKTSLLNAIRYAFFGTVLGRGSRHHWLHTISNRDRAAAGSFGFKVALTFNYDGAEYELYRECRPIVALPANDSDYTDDVLLRRDNVVLGPQERERSLQLVFPLEISRFFLFDGELLQEYEELLINESSSGRQISAAIERILGVPILKRARAHLTQLSEEADRVAAREASKRKETQSLGAALEQATEQKEAHKAEIQRLQERLQELTKQRSEVEQTLQSMQKYASILQDRDKAELRLEEAAKEERACRSELQHVMSDAWRTLLRGPVQRARNAAQADVEGEIENFKTTLRIRSLEEGRCEVCGQDLSTQAMDSLAEITHDHPSQESSWERGASNAMSRLADLNKFRDSDNAGEVRQLWRRLQALQTEQVALRNQISDLTTELEDSDPETLRRSRATFGEVIENLTIVKQGIERGTQKVEEIDQSIQRITRRLEASGQSDLRLSQAKAKILREAADVFGAAVEDYKSDLRRRVEETASSLFLSMTTEKLDYAGLSINENYGLTIRHKDGRAEEARSAGAEHVVALALMGALQKNAPLRGPIVMDSPFGRLDESHTANVVRTLPQMAQQVVLMVYESEVGMPRVREILGVNLRREYRLDYVSARRTNIREMR